MRRELGLTQARMAEDLSVSASYLNLVERNQRPVSAQLLLRLAEVYDISLRGLGGDDEAEAFATLNEVFSDPLFSDMGLQKQDLQDLADASPAAAEAVNALYRAYREANELTASLAEQLADREDSGQIGPAKFPVEEVRDFIRTRRNHFPELDEAAEALHGQLELGDGEPSIGIRRYLMDAHGVRVRVMPSDVLSATMRRFDRHRRRVLLSELLDQSTRNFQMAYHIALLDHPDLITRIVEGSGLSGEETKRLARVQLANYFAAALLMPYGAFLKSAEKLRYDIVLLGRRFGTSFEQVAHRLTTLQRPGERGVPFFFLRIDNAGNVSKRYSAAGFPFARHGGACPRWNIHDAFRVPGQILTQIVRMPDGATYFSIARTVTRPGSPYGTPDQQLAVGLGCEIQHAKKLVYADGFALDELDRLAMPIGINCRLCERLDCGQRAFAPLRKRLVIDEHTKGLSPFSFSDE